jgi:hypothetical protein
MPPRCHGFLLTLSRDLIVSVAVEYIYYESIKRELKMRPIYECRRDERLKTKAEELHASHTLGSVTGDFVFPPAQIHNRI